MRELLIRQTTVELLRAAQEAAIAGIGMRGDEARSAMERARTSSLRAQRAERWSAIVRMARRSKYALTDVERESESEASQ